MKGGYKLFLRLIALIRKESFKMKGEKRILNKEQRSGIIEKLVKKNFGILFSESDISIKTEVFDSENPYTIYEVIIYNEASIKFEIAFDFSVNAINLYTGFGNGLEFNQLRDITATVNAIIKTLNLLKKSEDDGYEVLFSNDEYVITSEFKEIGFNMSNMRELLVHRNKMYSLITFNSTGAANTIILTEVEAADMIKTKSETKVRVSGKPSWRKITMDVSNDEGVIFFVDYEMYTDPEEELNDME